MMDNVLDRFKLTDKVAIVTGAGKGIGKGIALALAEAGAHVVCLARTAADIEETAELVRARGRRALAIPCDVTNEEQLEQSVNTAVKEFGRIDILVNNAGTHVPAAAMDVSAEYFERALRLTLTSCFLLMKLVVPIMAKTSDGGAVINISSTASYIPLKGFAPYGAAKAGLNQLTNILAAEFGPKVRVNGIIVGSVQTPGSVGIATHMAKIMAERAAPAPGAAVLSDDEKRKLALAQIPLRRRGEPSDIAAGVVFLASPAASWITGTMLYINGGASNPSVGGGYPVPEL